MVKHILSIAGTDPTSGAGIQADLKTISALGAYAFTVCTAVLAQNTSGVQRCFTLNPDVVKDQLDSVFEDTQIDAVKIGMVGSPMIVETIVDRLRFYKPGLVVFDPVISASSGHTLTPPATIEVIRDQLLPLCTLVTPNLAESAILLQCNLAQSVREMFDQARQLLCLKPKSVLIKGGHLRGVDVCPDLLHFTDATWQIETPRIAAVDTHGTGCTLSAAIATYLADRDVVTSVKYAKNYVYHAIASHNQLRTGKGRKPLNHFYKVRENVNWQETKDYIVQSKRYD